MEKQHRTKQSANSNREGILVAAIPLFSDNGYAAVTIREIATKAKVNIPTLYHHFGDKLGLYQECCSIVFLRANEKIISSIDSNESPKHKAISFIATLYEILSGDNDLSKLFLRELADRDEDGLAKLTNESFFSVYETLGNVMESMIGKIPDRMQVLSVFALTFGLAQMAHMRPAIQDDGVTVFNAPEEAAKFVLQMMLPGWKA